jgi:transcriptional regulator with XRE-family HTH domain
MKNLNRPAFALNIIRFRKLKGLSQVDLAKITGLSKRMIAYYETEAVKPPIDKLELIAKALGVTISDIIEEKKENTEILNFDPRILKITMMLKDLNRKDKEYIYGLIKSLDKEYIYGLIKSLYEKNKKMKEIAK